MHEIILRVAVNRKEFVDRAYSKSPITAQNNISL